ncbi:MAG: hypothetical protein Q8L79_15735 [Methylobacter sp.]|uniref:hypothetical protein n=1 Tax=Methylobacter sp. TaxID=2051955 RepID=UPI00272F9590|nr:hypothetical protein [Methylobacter sp.]MDP1666561.1 hypothetical protein [Methylobacter sp.]
MNRDRLGEVILALNQKKVSQPCPRCSSNNFSVIGESEITVDQTSNGLLSLPIKTAMPTIVVACDNCGYISQHAQATLGLLPKLAAGTGILGRMGSDNARESKI